MPYKDESERKAKHAGYSREHYLRNKDKQIAANNKYRKAKREEWQAFKTSLCCTKCNFSHPAALDFHHTDPSQKEGNVHRFAANGQYKRAYEEVKKCIVLCANCHRVLHAEENKVQSP